MCVTVCARVPMWSEHACVRASLRASLRASVRASVRACMRSFVDRLVVNMPVCDLPV